ncbi:MAG: hypothetical protein HDKAJFGB_03279 [Anaerolineae bacterium]|nr:hypothetical protein [Anaerolineae bacterium]
MTNKNAPAIEMNRRDQPIFIAADIKHHPSIHEICRRKYRAQFLPIPKILPPHDCMPTRERNLRVWGHP